MAAFGPLSSVLSWSCTGPEPPTPDPPDFRQFSVERLMRFLVALGQDVEIVVKPHRDTGVAAALNVA